MKPMLFLAVNTIDKLKEVPPKFWLEFAICIVGFFVAVFVLKRILQINKALLFVAVFLVCALTFISWVYERNEPAFLTPFVSQLAQFLPTKDAYAQSENRAVIPDNTPKKPAPPPPSHVY